MKNKKNTTFLAVFILLLFTGACKTAKEELAPTTAGSEMVKGELSSLQQDWG